MQLPSAALSSGTSIFGLVQSCPSARQMLAVKQGLSTQTDLSVLMPFTCACQPVAFMHRICSQAGLVNELQHHMSSLYLWSESTTPEMLPGA